MTPFEAAYADKRMSANDAMALVQSGENIAMGMALSEPPSLLAALAQRLEEHAVSGLKLWYFHSMPAAAETVLRYELLDRIQPNCMFMGSIERELAKRGEAEGRKVVNFVPVAFSDAPRLFERHVDLDTCISVVSPMDRHGYFSFGTNNDYASTAARTAKRTIVEVNPQMPRVFGDSMIHISEVDALIEHDAPLHEASEKQPSEADKRIGALIADMVPDGACLQMGIGALPGIVCEHLKTRHDLGIHTELLSPGLVELIECGAVTNRHKATYPGRTVFTFALGNKRMYDLLDDNPAVSSQPVNIVNDPRHIAKNPGVISINATLQVDLSGACNSETLKGRQYSGSGGQLDFVRGARASKGGRSIIVTRSTTRDGKVSRIVPELTGAVTTPRNDVDTIVTEFGAACLIGLSAEERAVSLIALAHPDHREELTLAARASALID